MSGTANSWRELAIERLERNFLGSGWDFILKKNGTHFGITRNRKRGFHLAETPAQRRNSMQSAREQEGEVEELLRVMSVNGKVAEA